MIFFPVGRRNWTVMALAGSPVRMGVAAVAVTAFLHTVLDDGTTASGAGLAAVEDLMRRRIARVFRRVKN